MIDNIYREEAWHKATNGHLFEYRNLLTQNLSRVYRHTEVNRTMRCNFVILYAITRATVQHFDKYAGEIIEVWIAAGNIPIPLTG